jgi:cephalosporin-C deacetylase-like acetyl esterase
MNFVDFLAQHRKVQGDQDHLGFSCAISTEIHNEIHITAKDLTQQIKNALRQPEISDILEINDPDDINFMFQHKLSDINFAIDRIKEELTFFKFAVSRSHHMDIRFQKDVIKFAVFNSLTKTKRDELYIYQQVHKVLKNSKINLVFFDKGMEGSICLS